MSSGVTVRVCVFRSPPPASRSTSNVIGLPALSKHRPGSRIGSKSSLPSTLTIRSPLRKPAVSAGESLRMPLIGSISSRRPKSTKWLAGSVSSNCSSRRAVLAGRQDRPALDHVLDRPIGVPGEQAIVLERSCRAAPALHRRDRPRPGRRPSTRAPCLRARDKSGGLTIPGGGAKPTISRLSLATIPIVGAIGGGFAARLDVQVDQSFVPRALDLEVEDLPLSSSATTFLQQVGEAEVAAAVDRDDLVAGAQARLVGRRARADRAQHRRQLVARSCP